MGEKELNQQYIFSVISERIANLSDWNLAEILAEKELQEKGLSVEEHFPDLFRKKLDQVKRNRALAERKLLRYYTKQKESSLAEDAVVALRAIATSGSPKSSSQIESIVKVLRTRVDDSLLQSAIQVLNKVKTIEKEIASALKAARVVKAVRLLEENKIDPSQFESLARDLYEKLKKEGSPLAKVLKASFLSSIKKKAQLRVVKVNGVDYIARPAVLALENAADFEYLKLAVGELRKRGSTDDDIVNTLTDPEKATLLFKELFPNVYTDVVPFCFKESVVRTLL